MWRRDVNLRDQSPSVRACGCRVTERIVNICSALWGISQECLHPCGPAQPWRFDEESDQRVIWLSGC